MQHSHTHTHKFTLKTRKTPTHWMSRDRGRRGFAFPLPHRPPPFLPLSLTPSQVPGTSGGGGRKAWAGLPRPCFLPRGGRTGSWGSSRNPGSPHDFPPRPGCRGGGEGSGGPPRTPGFASAAGWGPVLRGPDRARPPRGGPVRERPPGGRPRGPEGAEPAAFPAPGARAGGRGVARGRGRGSEAAGARGPVRGRDLSRAQARAGRVRAAAPGVCLGVGDSPSGPRGVTARLGMTGRPPSEGRGGTPRAERVERQLSGRAAARPPARPAVCAVLTCQVSVCGTRLGGAVTCQAVCVHAVPVGDGDPLEDVCVTAGGSQPESRFIS